MGKSNIILYRQNDIETQVDLIRHNNAFIKKDGSFYLAKGYTDCNPSHQLESPALAVARKEIGYDIKKVECENYFQNLDINYRKIVKDGAKWLYYLRSVLVHYYGYVLFARQELIKSYNDRNIFFDNSLIPDPRYYGSKVTQLQIETLRRFFEINDDGTLYVNFCVPTTSQDIFQKVLNHENNISNWHH